MRIDTVMKALRADEAFGVRMHHDSAVFEVAACQHIGSVSSPHEINGLLPGSFAAKNARPLLPSVYDYEQCAGKGWVQGFELAAHPEDIAQGNFGKPAQGRKRMPQEKGHVANSPQNRC